MVLEWPERVHHERFSYLQDCEEDMYQEPVEEEAGADEWPQRMPCETSDAVQESDEDIYPEAALGGEGADRSGLDLPETRGP